MIYSYHTALMTHQIRKLRTIDRTILSSNEIKSRIVRQAAVKLDNELNSIEIKGGNYELLRRMNSETETLAISQLFQVDNEDLIRSILEEFITNREWIPKYYRHFVNNLIMKSQVKISKKDTMTIWNAIHVDGDLVSMFREKRSPEVLRDIIFACKDDSTKLFTSLKELSEEIFLMEEEILEFKSTAKLGSIMQCNLALSTKFKFKFISHVISNSGNIKLEDYRFYLKSLVSPRAVVPNPVRPNQTSPKALESAIFLHLGTVKTLIIFALNRNLAKMFNYSQILTFEGKLVRNVDSWKDLIANFRLLEATYPIQLQLRKNRLHDLANFWANTKITKIAQEDSFSQYLENVNSLENEGLSLETMKMPDELELSKNLFLLKIGKLMEKDDIKFNQAAHIISFQVINME